MTHRHGTWQNSSRRYLTFRVWFFAYRSCRSKTKRDKRAPGGQQQGRAVREQRQKMPEKPTQVWAWPEAEEDAMVMLRVGASRRRQLDAEQAKQGRCCRAAADSQAAVWRRGSRSKAACRREVRQRRRRGVPAAELHGRRGHALLLELLMQRGSRRCLGTGKPQRGGEKSRGARLGKAGCGGLLRRGEGKEEGRGARALRAQ